MSIERKWMPSFWNPLILPLSLSPSTSLSRAISLSRPPPIFSHSLALFLFVKKNTIIKTMTQYAHARTHPLPPTLLPPHTQVGAVNVTAEQGDMYFYPAAFPHKVHDVVGGTHTHVYIYVDIDMCIYMYVCICIYACTWIHIHVYMYIHVYIYIYICMYVCLYIYVHRLVLIYIYMNIYIYTYMYKSICMC